MNIHSKGVIGDHVDSPEEFRDEVIKVSLFVVSTKTPRLKRLNLRRLNSERGVEKLHQWTEEHRFVAVIEAGNIVYAHANARFVKQLNNQHDLSIEGKKVEVKTLTDEASEKLCLVGETFEEHLRAHPEENLENVEEVQVSFPRQYFAKSKLLSDQMQIDYFIMCMENIPGKIILAAMRRMNEEQHALNRRQREQAIEDQEKRVEIKHWEIKKDIIKGEIKENEIEHQDQKLEQVQR